MLYSELITELRRETRDFYNLAEELFDGDGASLYMALKNKPVKENSQQWLIGGVLKTETTHYTFDDDTAVCTWITAPTSGSDNVKCTYQFANFNDTDWINAINNATEVYGDKLWTELNDYTTLDTVANQSDYSLASVGSNIFRVIAFQYRTISSSAADNASQWINFSSQYNVTFLRDRNTVRLNPVFPITGYDIRVRALRRPATATSTSSTLDMDANEIKIIKEYAKYVYYNSVAAVKASQLDATSKDNTVTPASVLRGIAKDCRDNAESLCKKVRKPYPAEYIPFGAPGLPN